ncbi:hypothetical protein MTR67_007942 [Solanum verrucosum]|uniref:Reverse transcriptase zinc-binding domain-containing protein n=1 Tax=Solanum verrucosum TaxID=315347 RepID=A0AAF0TBW9_SOLVR|nr:hypothetical protein MTR67_007942 [Solanum verrucosum]
MKELSRMLDKAKQMQWISGFDVGRVNPVNISRLLYADDTLIFCGADRNQVFFFKSNFVYFEAISGLHINMFKRIMYPINVVNNMEELTEILGCGIGSFSTTYQGLPLGDNFKSSSIWSGVVEEFEKKLASWRMQYLSMGGRLTKINSVLGSIPTNSMSLFPLPGKTLEQLDQIRRNFLQEGNSTEHKFHLVEWDKVILPKYQSGLGIKDQAKHNRCLLMKWLWRHTQEDQSLWKEVVREKHGSQDHWSTKQAIGPHGVGIWKCLSRLWDEFSRNDQLIVGNGQHVKFWKDRWLGNTTLKGNDIAPDQFRWGHTDGWKFRVKAAYKIAMDLNVITDNWPWKLNWKVKFPPKIVCFSWTAMHEACLTQDNFATCVTEKQKLIAICFSNARLPQTYGACSSPLLE